MNGKAKRAASPLLGSLHDTATDLYRAGVMDLKTLREYDALCLDEGASDAKDTVHAPLRADEMLASMPPPSFADLAELQQVAGSFDRLLAAQEVDDLVDEFVQARKPQGHVKK